MADSNVRNMEEAQNLRSSDRIRAFLRAQIIFNNRMSTIDCIVKNISPTGARIALNDALTVPTEFELYIPQRGRSHHARLVWRDKDAIGVDFIDVPP
ncbi:MAG: PilZ domain-containing protein, partial [Xanthobacteraceae bacterium]